MDSIDFFSPEQCNLRVMINPEYDQFPVIERNGSLEIDFIPSPVKNQTIISGEFQQILLTPQKQASIEKYQEQMLGKNKINLLVSQHSPQVIMLNEKEKIQVTKVLEETSTTTNTSLIKTYNNELIPILDTPSLYSSQKSQIIQEKMVYLLRKQPAPQNLRKRIWPYGNRQIYKFKSNKKNQVQIEVYNQYISKFFIKLQKQLIGNKLRINKKLYKNLENQMIANPICSKVSNLIREDMHRTYPNFSLFDKGSQTNETLQTILEQFNYFRPDIGYVQGMAYPAAILFLYLGDSYLTFKYFNNLIAGNEFISNLYKFKIDKIKIYIQTFDFFLSQKYPNCTKHLQKLHIQSDIFLIEWFYTLYCRAFSFTTVAKIWDLMLTQGEVIFYKVGISIFGCIEKDLMDKDFDDTLFLIRNCTNKIDSDYLIKLIYSQKLTTENLYKKYQKTLEEIQLAEKQQKKKDEMNLSLNSSASSSTSTQSSNSTANNTALRNSAIKSDQQQSNNNNIAKDQDLKTSGLEIINELNSSTHSSSILTCLSTEQTEECNNQFTTNQINQDLLSHPNKENNHSFNNPIISKTSSDLAKTDSSFYLQISNVENQIIQ